MTSQNLSIETIDSVECRVVNELTKLQNLEYLLFMLWNRTSSIPMDHDNATFPYGLRKQPYPSIQHDANGISFLHMVVAKTPISTEIHQEVEHFCNDFVIGTSNVMKKYQALLTLALFRFVGLDFYQVCLDKHVSSKDITGLISSYIPSSYSFDSTQSIKNLSRQRELIRTCCDLPCSSGYIYWADAKHNQEDMLIIEDMYYNIKEYRHIVWDEKNDRALIHYLMNRKS